MISGDFKLSEMQQVSNTSNAATVAPVAPTKKAQERIDALNKAGVDTTNLFALGEGMVVRMVNGVPTQVFDDDPVWKKIMEAGTVPDRRLFRRWVLAQTFYMLRNDYTKSMKQKGYEYTWRMTEEELRVQAKLFGHDNENFSLRNRFFNRDVASAMAEDYKTDLKKHIEGLKTRHCKGVPYKRIYGNDVFVSDLDKKVYQPVYDAIRRIDLADTPKKLYEAVRHFNKARVPMHNDMKQSSAWVDAYKGAGAYFSMQNLIRFHGMFLVDDYHRHELRYGEEGIKLLDKMCEYRSGWELLGVLKEAIKYNHIDIDKKMAEWSK